MKNCTLYIFPILFLTLSTISCKNSIAVKTAALQAKKVCNSYFSDLLNKQVYTRMEIEPEFPGGMSQYVKFMNRHVRVTPEMIEKGSRQTSVGFILMIDTDGQIKYPAFHGSIDTTEFNPLEKEIYRVLKLMPKWTPGMCNGKTVAGEVKRSMTVNLEKGK
ncbi:hypothetical protein A3860_28035 [Niastella vici]|uniref:TonB C-terminal domain-containing protein n=1 Tax=Niastella vici TaxID=1703345 RepID=A0A1V9FW16_9BACT|nr:hypothetical protein [Niastella vici]OQP62543.1 hypothetical protein A3860_28035 [Niastella vici]